DGLVTDPDEQRRILLDALRAEEDAWRIADGVRPSSFTRGLLVALDAHGVVGLPADEELIEAQGPTDERPYSWSAARRDAQLVERAVGAPEAILALALELPAEELRRWREVVEAGAGSGGRLVLLARRLEPGPWRPEAVVDFADPLRPGMAEAVAVVRDAGIQVLVVTGDHPATATAIAGEAGIDASHLVTGAELDGWDDERLRAELPAMRVVARAIPEQKLRLVRVARGAGRTVAVTGDGVNDAPALNAADVAVAMGSGTDVAKGASDLVLGDDSFATLTYALREGRRIVANMRGGLVFLVSTHVALLGFLLIATVFGYDQPLLPIQILWLELFIDISTSVAFEREPEEPGAMGRPPRPRDRPLLTNELLTRISVAGGFSAVMALVLISQQGVGAEHARWLAFTALVVAQAVRANSNRSLTVPVWRLPPNTFLLLAGLLTIAVQAAFPYVPVFAEAFHAVPLDPLEWALVALIALIPAVLAQLMRAATGRAWVA
ncbi:MAG: HAD-IC family P-type ATPase, partial [Candidatus Limnocylindrales bacterium]